MLGILSFLKSGKVLMGMFIVIFLVGAGWYISNLRQDVQDMEDQVTVLTNNNQSLQTELERSRQEYESQIDALNASLNTYMSSLAMVKETSRLLEEDLMKVSENDEELEACLNRDLPDSVIQRLLNNG